MSDLDAEYDRAFDRAVARVLGQLTGIARESGEAAPAAADLLREPEEARRDRIREEPRFQTWKLCESLLESSREAWSSDPAVAVGCAATAVAVAEQLDPERYGSLLVNDALASAWAYLGNSYRIASDLREADEALRRAEEQQERHGGDPLTGGEILCFTASLRNSQGRFDEAIRLLDRAIALYRDHKDRHLEGRALIQKGMAHGYAGDFREGIRLLRRGLLRIDVTEEPLLLVAAQHNLILFLHESGRHRKAFESLEKSRRLYESFGDRMHLIRLRWLEGKIARDMGRLDEAGAALREARDAFVERGIGFDAALVSLDLALVYAARGDSTEVKRLAAEMVPVFESRDVHPEAVAALLIFQDAAEAERVTTGLVDRIAAYLRRARRDPELRFRFEP